MEDYLPNGDSGHVWVLRLEIISALLFHTPFTLFEFFLIVSMDYLF